MTPRETSDLDERLTPAKLPGPLAIEAGLFDLGEVDPRHLWAFTCPTPGCECRTALVLASSDRDLLLRHAATVRDAAKDGDPYYEVAARVPDVQVLTMGIDLPTPCSGGPGGWWILDEPELHVPTGDVLVSDLAGWRVARMPELPETAYFETSPDWVCEVLSPSTEADDRADKLPIHARAGVEHAWLVDPILRTLEVFRREGERWTLLGTFRDDAIVRAEPFDAVPLELGALWGKPAGA